MPNSLFIDKENPATLPFCPECGYQMVEPEPKQFICLTCGSTKQPELVSMCNILDGSHHDILIYEQQLQAHGVPSSLIHDFEKALLENAVNRAVIWCNNHHCAHSKGEDDIAHAIMGN